MELPARRKPPHEIPFWVTEGSWFFITVNCSPPNKNQLCLPANGHAILAAIKHNHEHFIWHCRLCLLMPDHLHAVLAFPPKPGMQTTIANWKRYVARRHQINWQRDFFDHRLRNRHELDEKTGYILMNPVRKGLCQETADWPWIYRPSDRLPPIPG